MGAIQPEEASVLINTVDTEPSAMATGADTITGSITNFSESGGEEDVESTPVFGGGNIDKIKPRTQIEVSFDIILEYGSSSTLFDTYKWGAGLKSDGDSVEKTVSIEFTDGTNFYSRVYNNVRAVTFEPESAADDFLKGTITFKLSPTTSVGVANLQIAATAVSVIPDWA